jgi:hypothetical protein
MCSACSRRRVSVIAILVIVVAVMGIMLVPIKNAATAGGVLAFVRNQHPGVTTELAARRAMFNTRADWTEERTASGSVRLTYTAENTPLYNLRLAPRTTFVAGVTLQNGVVNQADASLSSRWAHTGTTVSVADEGKNSGLSVRPMSKSDGFAIELGRDQTPERRMCAFDLNTTCLYKPGGCMTVKSMAPCTSTLR